MALPGSGGVRPAVALPPALTHPKSVAVGSAKSLGHSHSDPHARADTDADPRPAHPGANASAPAETGRCGQDV